MLDIRIERLSPMGIKITPNTSDEIVDIAADMIAYRLGTSSIVAKTLLSRMGPVVTVSRKDDEVIFDYGLKQIAVFRNIESNRLGCVVHERRRLNIDLPEINPDI